MTFLQPLILIALPLMALPILIHLINQHRHRTVPWAAMMFLVSAKRMNRGMARLRYILIMLLRMAAVGAVIFAVSRPLASGWLGGVGLGKPDATLVLLDRSASMEVQDLQTGESKRSTALKKLAELLGKRDYGSQLVLIDSASERVQLLESPSALLELPVTEATATSADIPGMLGQGLAFLSANESGRADIWICSDLSENDWAPSSGRWAALRAQLAPLKGVQHYLLSYAEQPLGNVAVRVSNVVRRQRGNRAELVLDVLLKVTGPVAQTGDPRRVPVEFEVNNVRSVVELELDHQGAVLLGHRIPIDGKLRSGWGSVSLPGDVNLLDNRFYFVFSETPDRHATIVTEDARVGEAFRLGLAIPAEADLEQTAQVIAPDRVGEIDWETTGLLIWQAPLPTGLVAEQVEQFVATGRVVMFFPTVQLQEGQIFGTQWGSWQQLATEEQRQLSWWRSDADLLAHVGSGDALPLSDLRTYRHCSIVHPQPDEVGTPLARLANDVPLLLRAPTKQGAVYFCGTLPTVQFSTLQRDAVAYYVLLQRALTNGSRALARATQRDAGPTALSDRRSWEVVAPGSAGPTLSERGLHAGVYQHGDYWAAINRGQEEDGAQAVTAATVDGLFTGLSYRRIDDAVGATSSLASEIWRAFLIAMVLALLLEALLCLPETKSVVEPPRTVVANPVNVQQAGSA